MLLNHSDGEILVQNNILDETQENALKTCLKSLEGFSYKKAEEVLYEGLRRIANSAYIQMGKG